MVLQHMGYTTYARSRAVAFSTYLVRRDWLAIGDASSIPERKLKAECATPKKVYNTM